LDDFDGAGRIGTVAPPATVAGLHRGIRKAPAALAWAFANVTDM